MVVRIDAGGTGSYQDLPHWEGDPFACTVEDAERESGDFRWIYSEELDAVLFSPVSDSWGSEFEAGGTRGDDWDHILYFVCMPDLPGWIVLDRLGEPSGAS